MIVPRFYVCYGAQRKLWRMLKLLQGDIFGAIVELSNKN